jgi:hypothetical protein
MEKIYSVVIKGQRFDFTQADLESIKKGTTITEGGRKFIHLFTKNGRMDVLKEDFDKTIEKLAKEQETPKE